MAESYDYTTREQITRKDRKGEPGRCPHLRKECRTSTLSHRGADLSLTIFSILFLSPIMGPYSKSSTTSNWKSDLSRPGKLKN